MIIRRSSGPGRFLTGTEAGFAAANRGLLCTCLSARSVTAAAGLFVKLRLRFGNFEKRGTQQKFCPP